MAKLDTRREAKAFVKTLKEQLAEKGLLENVDSLAMQLLETSYHTWLDATEFLLENGTTFIGTTREKDKVHKPYPQLKIQADAQAQLTKLLAEFGCTSNSRKKIGNKPVPEDNPLAEFFNIEKR